MSLWIDDTSVSLTVEQISNLNQFYMYVCTSTGLLKAVYDVPMYMYVCTVVSMFFIADYLWTAPELLRPVDIEFGGHVVQATQKADIYAVGIIIHVSVVHCYVLFWAVQISIFLFQEIIARRGPFDSDHEEAPTCEGTIYPTCNY